MAQREGKFTIAWSIKDLAKNHYDQADEISAWAAASASNTSRNLRKTGNGSLQGDVHKLSVDKKGHPRFYMQANYAGNGVFIEGQLSIWEWTGTEAIPLVVKSYPFILFQSGTVLPDGNLLRIRTDVIFKTIGNARLVIQPEGEWAIRVTPEKIEDLGGRLLVPEMSLMDDLYDRLWRQAPADDIASPAVIAMLTKAAAQIRNDPENSWGPQLSDWQLFRSRRRAQLCMDTDEPGRYLFTLVKKHGRLFVAVAKDVSNTKLGASCAWVLAASR